MFQLCTLSGSSKYCNSENIGLFALDFKIGEMFSLISLSLYILYTDICLHVDTYNI